jgi:hypothetical protein
MTITDAIRESTSEHEIYFLLTCYVEAVRYCDKLSTFPEPMRELPFLGMDDLKDRVEALTPRLDAEAEVSENRDLVIVREAIEIFSTAWGRLLALEEEGSRALPQAA